MKGMEIERKFIIRKPKCFKGLRYVDMVQTYLVSESGSERVRAIQNGDVKEYIFTRKIRRTALSCEETEYKISENDYQTLLKRADPSRTSIEKRRYYYEYQGQTFEIDVYPFWRKQCVMELELQSEEQGIVFPPDIEIIEEVSHLGEYKNAALARHVPEEMI